MLAAQLRSLAPLNQQSQDALSIWAAGTTRVLPQHVIPTELTVDGDEIVIAGRRLPTAQFESIYIFGAGKAGAAMAVEVEKALRDSPFWQTLRGRVNVPAQTSALPRTAKIELQVARPSGHNFPTAAGEEATQRMLADLSALSRTTLAIGLISGGGSALLELPRAGISVEQIAAVSRFLQASGATIHELNGVRSWLSQVKAGGVARICTAGRVETLIISDVVGDDLGVIASGPCFASDVTARQASETLRHFVEKSSVAVDGEIDGVLAYLDKLAIANASHTPLADFVHNNLIATNELALDAAKCKADELGYRIVSLGSTNQGDAYEGGRRFAKKCHELRQLGGRWCVLSGGEPTLVLNPSRPAGSRGGRNQAWALAALDELGRVQGHELLGLAILAGGTDGEDGPCDVAGAVATQKILDAARDSGLDPAAYLNDNNEYAFFAQTGGHLDTGGGTQTNVCDLRVACVIA